MTAAAAAATLVPKIAAADVGGAQPEGRDMSKTRKLVETFIDHVANRRVVEAFNMLNEDGVYIMIGDTPLSGKFHGRKDVLERFIAPIAKWPSPPSLTFGDIIVDGDKAAVRASGGGVGPTGPYSQPYYMFYMKVEGDGFSEMIEYLDTVAVEVAAYGKKLVPA